MSEDDRSDQPCTTAEVAQMAVGRVGASLRRKLRTAGAYIWAQVIATRATFGQARAARPKTTLAVIFAVVVLGVVLAILPNANPPFPGGQDLVSALARARVANQDNRAPLLHAKAAIEVREFGEALEVLERARVASPGLASDSTFVALSLQTFNAGRPSRSASLLGLTPKDEAIAALHRASLDWSYRVRHGAADLLKSIGVELEDPIGFGLLDVWQLERCEQRRATASKLLSTRGPDLRLVAGLQAASRRAADEGCLRDLLPPASAAR